MGQSLDKVWDTYIGNQHRRLRDSELREPRQDFAALSA